MMVAVLVMNRQELAVRSGKFPAAVGAYQAMDGQGTLPVILARGLLLDGFHLPDHFFQRPGGPGGGFPYDRLDAPAFAAEGHFSHAPEPPILLSAAGERNRRSERPGRPS